MRYSDLINENILGSQQDVRDMIQTIIMSLVAQGVDDIPTSMVSAELRKQANMEVPYGQLVDILLTIPLVGSADTETISFNNENEEMSTEHSEEDAKSKVAAMATKGVKAEKTF